MTCSLISSKPIGIFFFTIFWIAISWPAPLLADPPKCPKEVENLFKNLDPIDVGNNCHEMGQAWENIGTSSKPHKVQKRLYGCAHEVVEFSQPIANTSKAEVQIPLKIKRTVEGRYWSAGKLHAYGPTIENPMSVIAQFSYDEPATSNGKIIVHSFNLVKSPSEDRPSWASEKIKEAIELRSQININCP
jgi:hypothetical protein